MTTKAYVADKVKDLLVEKEWTLPPMDDHSAKVEITHCGLCHTDKHMIDNEWGVSRFPLCAGHEGIGKVVAVGPQVKNVKPGDRVGIGWMRDSCDACDHCLRGEENICLNGYTGVMMGEAKNNGCFSREVVMKSKFLFKIPDAIDSVDAAPLMCAGITVYTPLRKYLENPGMKVGVIGIGGLGHLALQFARHMGAHVVAFSTSPDKEAEAKAMGAHDFVCTKNGIPDNFKNYFEFILNTAHVPFDYNAWAAALRPGGNFCVVGVPASTVSVNVIPFVFGQKSFTSSLVGGRRFMKEMLELAALNNIKPKCEVFPFEKVNEAIDHVVANKARYRVVLKY